jgi:hypothetical protein
MKLTLSKQEYEQFKVDLECVVEELEELSATQEWYVSELPDRMRVLLEILERAE